MADDRPAESDVEQLARVDRELADLRSTVMARLARRPTGDIEPTIRKTAKPDTLLLQGQTVSRATYAGLWRWVQDQGLVMAGLFTSGDGSTTFGLPDFRGRVPVGVGTLGSDTYTLGQLFGVARHALTVDEMPAHSHTLQSGHGVSTTYGHDHGGTGGGGTHNGHNSGGVIATTADRGNLLGVPATQYNDAGYHSHGLGWDSHNHGVTLDALTLNNTGSGSAHENRPPSIAINWAIWT